MKYEHLSQVNSVIWYENYILITDYIVFIEKKLFYSKRNIFIRFILIKNTIDGDLKNILCKIKLRKTRKIPVSI
jgi:hypothetical protein